MKLSAKQSFKLNGPFYTGYFIESAVVIEKGYSNVQKKIVGALNTQEEKNWLIEGTRERSDLLYAIELAQETIYAGTPMISQSFLVYRIPIENHEISFQGHRFVIKSALIYYHAYGVGVYNLAVDLYLTKEVEVVEYRSLVEQFSVTLNSILNPYIESGTLSLKEALESNGVPIESYEEIAGELKEKGSDFLPLRKALWFHRVFIFEIPSGITEDLTQEFLLLLSSSQPLGSKNCSLSPHVAVYPGYGNSLLIHDTKLDKPINLGRLIALANFYYAATSLLDTIVFNKLVRFNIKKLTKPKIKEIEKELETVQNLSDRLELFLLTLKDSIINFSPDSSQMWKTLEAEWYYTPLLTALKEKVELLQQKSEELLDELNQKRQITLNKFVKVFTAFAILGPAFEIYIFLHDNQALVSGWTDFILENLVLLIIVGIPVAVSLVGLTLLIARKTLFRY